MRVRILRGLNDVAEISGDWDSLAATAGSPTQHYIWFRCAAEAFALDRRLRVVEVESGGRVVAIAPLFSRPGIGRHWELISVRELGEPVDLLHADDEALASLSRALRDTGVPLSLGRIAADSRTLATLRSSYRGSGMVIERPAPGCPRIPLDESWTVPESHVDAGRRSDLRRARRRAETLGSVRHEFLAPGPGQVGPLLDEAYRVEAAGWKGRERSALVHDRRIGTFFRRFAVAASEKGWLRLAFLRIGGRAAAMQLAVELGGAYWLLKVGYDEEFARCSPGTLLTAASIRHAAQRGLLAYEFLGVEETWVRPWTRSARRCVSVWMHPWSLSAVVALTLQGGRFAWRRASRVLRRR